MLGDDLPPDELNNAPKAGMNFGYPYFHAGTIKDRQFGGTHQASEFTAPAQNLGPHVASLGLKFYTGNMFPAEYKDQLFIAEHGSWNRTKKNGYRVSLVKMKDGKTAGYETFATGGWTTLPRKFGDALLMCWLLPMAQCWYRMIRLVLSIASHTRNSRLVFFAPACSSAINLNRRPKIKMKPTPNSPP